ncbi:unnamed protein product [Gongylonema pulchrum]|uniref:Uncharacterized protein n=1 Tax=Gongylonema pulchrum TaxID=637853 RepID=A0A183EFS9_9BILA|nr:unnamed protein product [Gongylonema pulchrum]
MLPNTECGESFMSYSSNIDSDEDEDRLQIVADEAITFPSTSSAPERQQAPQQSNQAKEKISKPTAAKKQTSEVKSELYRKMHKRIAVQTLRMKELGRLKKPEQEESDQSPKVCEQRVKVEKPSRSIPQKRSAILLPQSPVVLAKRPRVCYS